MKRDLHDRLVTWKHSSGRKPLLMRGARQTGKTYLLKAFGREEYAATHYFNFEKTPDLAGFFDRDLDPRRIVGELSTHIDENIQAESSLIIFDEIQACNAALNSLKYFQEDAGEFHVACAGSLLGVALSQPRSFPVGKVDFVDLYPMTFFEFLDGIRESRYRSVVEGHHDLSPFPDAFHHTLQTLLRTYYYVGGMPEAVKEFAASQNLVAVRETQQAIMDAYVLDFAKHAPVHDVPKLSAIWESLPKHLSRENKKFIFSAVEKSARARDYEDAIIWLEMTGLIHRVFAVETARLPLKSYADRRCFKVYALDVGLLGALAGVSPRLMAQGDRIFSEYRGALVENFVAQHLAATSARDLHYWRSSGGKAEVDFLIEKDGALLPLEVKAGTNPRSKSLKSFDAQFAPPALVRATLLNLKKDDRILNIPLYAIGNALQGI